MPSGESTENEEQILQEVFTFSAELYWEDPTPDSFTAEINTTLELISKRVTPEENTSIENEPSAEEVRKVITEMPTVKSPRIDGVTSEVLLKCWAFMGRACYKMVCAFSCDGHMTVKALAGVIKLILKKAPNDANTH